LQKNKERGFTRATIRWTPAIDHPRAFTRAKITTSRLASTNPDPMSDMGILRSFRPLCAIMDMKWNQTRVMLALAHCSRPEVWAAFSAKNIRDG
jgi:hypothetical protein